MKDSFILASNAEILLVSLLCSSFIIIIASKVGVDIFNKFWNLILNSAITTPLLFSFQLVILFFLPAYRNVVIIYLFLFSIGMNLYILITPSFLKERFSYLVLIPLVGLIVLSVLGAYFIGFNIQITLLGPALLFISLVASFIQFKFSREEFVSIFTELKADYKRVLIAGTGIATPLIFCLIFPVLLSDYSTSAYRIGPDLATYAKMSQFFLDGGTWVEAGKRAEEFAGMSVGEINRYCDATMSWPVNFYFRWGLTAYQVVVSVITFTKHSYETAFISLAVPYLLLCGFVLIWL